MAKKVGVILLIIFVLFVSEFLYIVNSHKINIISAYYLHQAQGAVKRNNTQQAIDSISRAAQIQMKSTVNKYPDYIPQNYNTSIIIPDTPRELADSYSLYIKSINLFKILQSYGGDIAPVIYTLGVLSYKNGGPQLTPGFFQTAVYLNPDLSHFNIELANYFLTIGDEKACLLALDYCSKFKLPSTHCGQYLDNNYHWKVPDEIGFLANPIEEHYQGN